MTIYISCTLSFLIIRLIDLPHLLIHILGIDPSHFLSGAVALWGRSAYPTQCGGASAESGHPGAGAWYLALRPGVAIH